MIFIVGLSRTGKTTYSNKFKYDKKYKVIHSDDIKIDIDYNKINSPRALDKAIQIGLLNLVDKYSQYKNTIVVIEGVDVELIPLKILSNHEIIVIKPTLEEYLSRFDEKHTSLEYTKEKYINYYSFIDKLIKNSKLNIRYA